MKNSKHIRNLFGEEASQSPSSENGYYFFLLKENDPLAKLKEVKIIGVSADAVLVKPDYANPLNDLLRNNVLRKRCDYILFTSYKNKDYVLLFELKSTKYPRINKQDVQYQLLGGKALIDYFDSLLFFFMKLDDSFSDFSQKSFLFHRPRIGKKGTKQEFPSPYIFPGDIEPAFYTYAPQNPSLHILLEHP